MCGIAGLWDRSSPREEDLSRTAAAMSATLRHRGPDDSGIWVDAAAGVGFGHSRLAVVDLSEHGHQPMVSAEGRFVLNYNGEIYNFAELRAELEQRGHRFAGSSDTEVLLASISAWGLTSALRRCNGMFALALWDRRERSLSFARDRLGEKPLYLGWAGHALLFGSELKALRAHPAFSAEVDRDVLAIYLRHNCVPGPYAIYRGVRKLSPGTVLTVSEQTPVGAIPEGEPFWALAAAVDAGAAARGASLDDVGDDVERVLRDAVRLRTFADVPVGAFLSGGVDSSLVVALMQEHTSRPVRTFTMAFEDAGFDESTDARRVAQRLGTEHCEMPVTADDALAVIPELARIYDEPFADSSQIPTVLLAALTRRHVTVALSGDGGDELFGGYNRHVWLGRLWPIAARLPRPLRIAAGKAVAAVPAGAWEAAVGTERGRLPARLRQRIPAMKAAKAAQVLGARSVLDAHRRLASHVANPVALVPGAVEPPTVLDHGGDGLALSPAELSMYLDTLSYLPDDILTKVDRATMAVGLEARVPFLDHHVVELAWHLPIGSKVSGFAGKQVLRQLLRRRLPAELVDRPKAGFGVPLASWLRGPLRPWAEDLLSAQSLGRSGLLDPVPVRALWNAHATGLHDHGYALWDILMFQSWLEGPANAAG